MLGFAPKLPISDEERLWVDEGFRRLERMLGRRRMIDAKVVLPSAQDFPEPYDKSAASAELLFRRVCNYMRVERSTVELEIFPDETEELRSILPHWSGQSSNCAGFYTHDGGTDGNEGEKRMLIVLRSTQLPDPMSLVATLAHELGHVILLGGGHMSSKTADHEPMTDLLTVFLGLGIFTANSAARFSQYQEERRIGWSMRRLGYLAEQVYGYALAKFARERGEHSPDWPKHLSTNARAYYKRSRKWLMMNPHFMKMAEPIG
jgi:hypothetical protein